MRRVKVNMMTTRVDHNKKLKLKLKIILRKK
jgi:hypothetical protein